MNKFEAIRKNYPGLSMQTYLDTPTTGLISRNSYEAMKKQLDLRYYEGINLEEYFDLWHHADKMRTLVAKLLNANESEVFYGKDCSEILNALTSNVKIRKGSNVVTADISFPSSRNTWLSREKDGLEVRFVKSQNGAVPFSAIKESVDENTLAISVCYVEPSSGFKHNLLELGEFCHKQGILLVVDATQCISAMEIDVKSMHIDFLAASTYKWMNNVFGLGIGYMSEELLESITPQIVGWVGTSSRTGDFNKKTLSYHTGAQRFETGGLNWLGIAGLEKSIENYLDLGKKDVENYILDLVEYLYQELHNVILFDVQERFPLENRSNIVYIEFPESLDLKEGFFRENDIRVHIAKNTMRIGLHFYNNKNDIDILIDFLKNIKK